MKRKHKTYSKPKRPFDKERLVEEAEIKKKFGLKNKKEIWKAEAKINSMREKAKKLISAGIEEQEALFGQLKKIGLGVNTIADVLSLDKKDYLNRRLQTILVEKNLATTAKTARQLITHKKVLIDGKAVDSPSYVVPVKLENKIELKIKKKTPKQAEAKEETAPAEEAVEVKENSGREFKRGEEENVGNEEARSKGEAKE